MSTEKQKKRATALRCDGMVGVPRAEIENLRRDAARLDTLERLWKREIHITRLMDECGDVCVVKIWATKYLTSYNYEGTSVRQVLDEVGSKHPNIGSQTQPPKTNQL